MSHYHSIVEELEELRGRKEAAEIVFTALLAQDFDPKAKDLKILDAPSSPDISDITNAMMEQPLEIASLILGHSIERLKAVNAYIGAIDDLEACRDVAGYDTIKLGVHRNQAVLAAVAGHRNAWAARKIVREECYKDIPPQTEQALSDSYAEALYLKGTDAEYDYDVPHTPERIARFGKLADTLDAYGETCLNQAHIALHRAISAGRNFMIMRTLEQKGEDLPLELTDKIRNEAASAFIDFERVVQTATDIAQDCIDMAEAIRKKGSDFQILNLQAPVRNLEFSF